jgi:hypothetical protein
MNFTHCTDWNLQVLVRLEIKSFLRPELFRIPGIGRAWRGGRNRISCKDAFLHCAIESYAASLPKLKLFRMLDLRQLGLCQTIFQESIVRSIQYHA